MGVQRTALFALVLALPGGVFVEDCRETNRVYSLPQGHDSVRVSDGFLKQVVEPDGFEGQADAQHQAGVGHAGDVPRARLEGVGVGVGGQQGKNVHPVLPDGPHPVGHNVAGGDYF